MTETATRGSRCRLRALIRPSAVLKSRSSPSISTQSGVICGEPSALRVVSEASTGRATSWRALSEKVSGMGVPFLGSILGDAPTVAGRTFDWVTPQRRRMLRGVTSTRTESDSMGEIEVPSDRYWGAQTARSLHHFDIGIETMPLPIVRAFGILKGASAKVNRDLGKLAPELAALIEEA